MKVGDRFKVKNDHGSYICTGFNSDGSIKAWGGTKSREKARNIRLENVRQTLKKAPAASDGGAQLGMFG